MFESIQPPPPPPRRRMRVHQPLIGFAVSLCVAVISLLTGIMSLCGTPGNGYNSGGGTVWTFTSAALITLFWISAVSTVVCFVWFLVALIRGNAE